MSQHEYMVTVIAKTLQGLATPQEAEELQLWLQQDAANQQEYDDMALIWQRSAPLLANTQFNTHAAWAKLDGQIAQLHSGSQTTRRPIVAFLFSSPLKAIAATLVLAVLAFGGYWWYQKTQWQSFTAVAQNENLTLPDQSVVTVRKGSTIKYQKTFDKKERRVQLSGEAFFKVQHNENQPFVVVTNQAIVKVLGTSFLVNATAATEEVVVVTGKVHVTDKNDNNSQVILTKGQRGVLQSHHIYQEAVNNSNFIAWETNQLVFKNTPLTKVLEDIAHYYAVPMQLATDAQQNAGAIQINLELNNQPLEQALEEIKLITGLQVKKEKDTIIFYQN